MRQANLVLKPSKMYLEYKDIEYLGHTVSENRLGTNSRNVGKISFWLQIFLSCKSTKYYENRSTCDRVITNVKGVNFFRHNVQNGPKISCSIAGCNFINYGPI